MYWWSIYMFKHLRKISPPVRCYRLVAPKRGYSNAYKKHMAAIRFNIINRVSVKQYSIIRDYNFDYFRKNISYNLTVVKNNNRYETQTLIINGTEYKSEMLFSYLSKRANVTKLSTQQVADVMNVMANSSLTSQEYSSALKWLDEKCAICVNEWSLDSTLYIFDAWLIILGQQIFRNNYFSAVTKLWCKKMHQCTKNNVIQILYYIGLYKKPPDSFLTERLLQRMEGIALEVSDLEWAIACISLFKMSKKLNSKILLSRTVLAAKAFMDQNENFHLISALKCLRLSRHYDEKLIKLLCQYIEKEINSFNFVECTNFLAALSSEYVYESDLFKLLEKRGIQKLLQEKTYSAETKSIKEHPSVQARVKDLAKFLWTLSSVGHNLEDATIEATLKFLHFRLSRGDFKQLPHTLIDVLQSLALENIYPQRLLEKVMESSFLECLWSTKRDKPRYQLYFLYKSIQIECNSLHKNNVIDKHFLNQLKPIPKDLLMHIKERKGFVEALTLLKKYVNSDDIDCCFVVPHIVIASIVIKRPKACQINATKDSQNRVLILGETVNQVCSSHNPNHPPQSSAVIDFDRNVAKEICIEILDPTVCCRHGMQPVGLLKAKIRQLRKLSYEVKVVTSDEIICLNNLRSSEQQSRVSALLGL